jgi:hypothetical protein
MAVAVEILVVIMFDLMVLLFVSGSFNDKLVIFLAGFATAAVIATVGVWRRQGLL